MLRGSWLLVILLVLTKANAELDTIAELEKFEKGSFLLDVKEFVDESAQQSDPEGGNEDIFELKTDSEQILEFPNDSSVVANTVPSISDAGSDGIELHSEDAVNTQMHLESSESSEENDAQNDDAENNAVGAPEPGYTSSEFEAELTTSETQEPAAGDEMLEASVTIENEGDKDGESGIFQKSASSSANRIEKFGSAFVLPVLVIAFTVISASTVF